jgi:hypothetical protein
VRAGEFPCDCPSRPRKVTVMVRRGHNSPLGNAQYATPLAVGETQIAGGGSYRRETKDASDSGQDPVVNSGRVFSTRRLVARLVRSEQLTCGMSPGLAELATSEAVRAQ